MYSVISCLLFYTCFPAGLLAVVRCQRVSPSITDAMAQIIPFHRGVNLVHEEYLYKKDRSYGCKQHWRCVTAGCHGRVKADFSNPPLVVSSKPHNHIRNEELLRSVSETCERLVRFQVCLPSYIRPRIYVLQLDKLLSRKMRNSVTISHYQTDIVAFYKLFQW